MEMQLPGADVLVFWMFAATLLLSALLVVTVRNPVYAALSLVLCFFSGAILWLPLNAEFLAILLILIYVGAVMVLFLFVVMMLDVKLSVLREGFARHLPVGLVVALLLVGGILSLLAEAPPPTTYAGAGWLEEDGARQLGMLLFTENLVPFEAAGAILLVAIIAALGINPKQRPRRLVQDPAEQVASAPKIRMVSAEDGSPLYVGQGKPPKGSDDEGQQR